MVEGLTKLSKRYFLWNVLWLIFRNFGTNVAVCLSGSRLGTRHRSKHFRDFLEIYDLSALRAITCNFQK